MELHTLTLAIRSYVLLPDDSPPITCLQALKENFQWWQNKTDSLFLALDSNRHNFQVVYVCSPIPTPLTVVWEQD